MVHSKSLKMAAIIIITRRKNNFINKSFQTGLTTTSSLLHLHFEHTNVITISRLDSFWPDRDQISLDDDEKVRVPEEALASKKHILTLFIGSTHKARAQ